VIYSYNGYSFISEVTNVFFMVGYVNNIMLYALMPLQEMELSRRVKFQ